MHSRPYLYDWTPEHLFIIYRLFVLFFSHRNADGKIIAALITRFAKMQKDMRIKFLLSCLHYY